MKNIFNKLKKGFGMGSNSPIAHPFVGSADNIPVSFIQIGRAHV
jgi:hypothetical protein